MQLIRIACAFALFLAVASPSLATQATPASPGAESPQCEPGSSGCATDPDAGATAQAEHRIDQPYGKAWIGAPDGDVTLIVFADYACPACREAQPVIDQLVAGDPKLRIVYRILVNEHPGLHAARISLAVAGSQADWGRFHHALDSAGEPTPKAIQAALAAAGIDPKSLPPLDDDSLVDSPITAELINNDALIGQRKGKAIPAWVLGDADALNGFDLAALRSAIARARSKTAK
ncbi:MAG: hypothetical protein JWO25_705 [Alphaproteobacteria bacterium]|nr:hypothetical protein [Alphaproteobacteria bacterium]